MPAAGYDSMDGPFDNYRAALSHAQTIAAERHRSVDVLRWRENEEGGMATRVYPGGQTDNPQSNPEDGEWFVCLPTVAPGPASIENFEEAHNLQTELL